MQLVLRLSSILELVSALASRVITPPTSRTTGRASSSTCILDRSPLGVAFRCVAMTRASSLHSTVPPFPVQLIALVEAPFFLSRHVSARPAMVRLATVPHCFSSCRQFRHGHRTKIMLIQHFSNMLRGRISNENRLMISDCPRPAAARHA